MGLTSTLNIGATALSASQVAIQTAGNNLANAATEGYSRQTVSLAPIRGDQAGSIVLGRGVGVTGVTRQIDEAVLSRLRASLSEEASTGETASVLGQLETILNELTDSDFSTQLQTFFGAWSDAANLITDGTGVVGKAEEAAAFIRGLRNDLAQLTVQVDQSINDRVVQANALLSEVAAINAEISTSEIAGAAANGLRDRRDQILAELSEEFEVTAVEQGLTGTVDVFIGSTPVVLGSVSLGVELEQKPVGTELELTVRVSDTGTDLQVDSGAIGGLLGVRNGIIEDTIEEIDTITTALIFEVNKLHTTGTNSEGLTSLTSTLGVPTADQTEPLNSTANETFFDLPFTIEDGSFLVRVTNTAAGTTAETQIELDLDGIDANTATTINDTTLAGVVTQLDAVAGINASIDTSGRVVVTSDAGSTFSFGEDSSNFLAAIGLGGFFTGEDATDIDVAPELRANPSIVRLGRIESDGVTNRFNENGTAIAINDLAETSIEELGNLTFRRRWSNAAQNVAVESGLSKTAAEASQIVRQSLDAQRAAVSGVSVDEETIDLISFQRQFQGAARLISIADELLSTLLSIV